MEEQKASEVDSDAGPEQIQNNENIIDSIMSVKDINLTSEEQGADDYVPDEGKEADRELDALKLKMLDHIARSNAHFKSQQRGEPDLSFHEKHKIAQDMLNRSPALFLSRFGKFLKADHVRYFHQYNCDYEVNFYVSEIEKSHCKYASQVQVKNRRYAALKAMTKSGDYFSEGEMKKRNPLLYEQLIGQYMTDEEREQADKIDLSNCSLTNIILDHIDRDWTKKLQKWQEEHEDDMMEESDSDEDDEKPSGEEILSSDEKEMLKEEFFSTMYRSFLEGKDSEFDYSEVDFNTDYDNLDIWQQDEEEKYFDSEEPYVIDTDPVSAQQNTNQMDVCDTEEI